MKSRRISFAAAVGLLLPLLVPVGALADTAFAQRYRVDQRGGIVRAANSVVTCKVGLTATAPPCADARAGANTSNNSYAFEFIDVDGDPATFDSSTADLKLPAGATVSHAELYWGANLRTRKDTPGLPAGNRNAPDSGKKNEVRFKVPGGAYETVTADDVYEMPIGGDPSYQARADVTGKVVAGGTYGVADVQAALGSSDLGAFGGWTLVVVYADPSAHLRNLTIYDGFRFMERFKPPITIDLAGFTTPASGALKAQLGWVVYDGDRSGAGDRIAIKTEKGPETQLGDSANPPNNPFNSTISTLGSDEKARDPAYANTLGYDSDVLDVSKTFRNGDTKLRLTMSTVNENYAPGVIFMQIDLYEAHLTLEKKATVVGGGNAELGSEIEYTMKVVNDGDESTAKVAISDAIPPGTSYVAGSLKIAGVAKTDAGGDDQADFTGDVNFRLGTGANATTGGELTVGKSVTVTFRVRAEVAAQGTKVKNTANLTYESKSKPGVSLTEEASAVTPVRAFADVAVRKTGPATVSPGATVTYTITVTNKGPDGAKAVTLTDTLGGQPVTGVSAPGCTESAGTLSCDLGDLAVGQERTVKVTATVPADAPPDAEITDRAQISSLSLDSNEANDADTARTRVVHIADVSLTKTGPSQAKVGQRIQYVITARNRGPDSAELSRVVDAVPDGLSNVTWTCRATGGGVCYTPSGTGTGVNAIADLPASATVVVRITGTVKPTAGKRLSNQAKVILGPSIVDPKPSKPVSVITVIKPKPKPKPTPDPTKRPKPPRDACRGCEQLPAQT